MANVTPDEVKALLSTERGAHMLAVLNRQSKHVKVLRSDIGQVLLGEALNKADELLIKISDSKASASEKAEFRVYKRILKSWLGKIDTYLRTVSTAKQAVKHLKQ